MAGRLRAVVMTVATATALAAAPSAATAQTVTGRIVDAATREPLAGALLTLEAAGAGAVGAGGAETGAGSTLSSERGAFQLRAPGPGTYRVRADRIGYRSIWSDTLRLGAGERAVIELEAPTEAITLGTIEVESAPRCRVRTDRGEEVEAVWEEARKALAMARATAARPLRYRVTRHARRLEPSDLRVIEEERTGRSAFHRGSPFVSRPAAELAEHGYVVRDPDGDFSYFGPDAEVLLSDTFLDQHCFGLTSDPDRPRLIGLRFEPILDRRLPDVKGVLWLDRTSARLELLEYTYTRLPWREIASDRFGGRVEFQRLATGDLVVSRWRIRMPVVAERRRPSLMGRARATERYLAEVRESGGDVIEVRTGRGERLGVARGNVIAGTVVAPAGESTTGARRAPLEGALVWLEGTDFQAVTGPGGAYRMDGVPQGTYTVRVSHASLAAIAAALPRQIARLDADGEAHHVDIQVPGGAGLARALCPDAADSAIVYGSLRSQATGKNVSGGLVFFTWSRGFGQTGLGAVAPARGGLDDPVRPYSADVMIGESWEGVQAITGDDGTYRVCGLPADQLVLVRAWADAAEGQDVGGGTLQVNDLAGRRLSWVTLRLRAGEPTRVDLSTAEPEPR